MTDYYSQFDAASKAFDENSLDACDNETLQKHLISLANEPVPNTAVQHRNIIRGITINHILLQRHIDRLNKQNAKTERWVIALAIAALISSAVQIFSPVLFREPHTEAQQQMSATQAENPSQATPQSSGQPTQKKTAIK